MSIIDPHVDGGMIDSEKETLLEQRHLDDAQEFNEIKSNTNYIIATKEFWKKHGYLPNKITSSWIFDDWDKIYQATQDLFLDNKYKPLEKIIMNGMKSLAKSFNNYKRLLSLSENNKTDVDFYLFKMIEAHKTFNDLNLICILAPPYHKYALVSLEKMENIKFKTKWQEKAIKAARQKHRKL